MLENGFVKLQRDITQRKWFKDRNTLQMYVTLLLRAAYRESEFEGITLKAGQLITSIRKLMEATYLTEQQTRTALNHLKATGDITVQSTSKFSIITLNHYPAPQPDNTRDIKRDITQGITQNINIIRKKEECKEEYQEEEEGASPAPASVENDFSSCSNASEHLTDDLDRQRLVKAYGNTLVERYEAKFRAWAAAKHAANVPMYPTIAKWLAMDIAPREKTPPTPQYPEPVPKRKSSIDTEKLRRAVMEQYRRKTI
ncbi:MAG: hypothetical protein K2J77_02205 [Oscillospiraceae bacterium]|nr:hypothetical protein [Oscillospiraceae bacterium]